MAQKRSLISLTLALLFGATSAPLFAMEPADSPANPSEQPMDQLNPPTPRDIRQAERNRQMIASMHQNVDNMLERTEPISSQSIEEMLAQVKLTNQEAEKALAQAQPPLEKADELIEQLKKELNPDNSESAVAISHVVNSNNAEVAALEVVAQKPASPQLMPAFGAINHDLDAFLQVEAVDTNFFGTGNTTPATSEPIEVSQEPMEFPNQPRFIPIDAGTTEIPAQPQELPAPQVATIADQQEEPSIPAGPTMPVQPQTNPAATITDFYSNPVPYDDMGYMLAATAGEPTLPTEEALKGEDGTAPVQLPAPTEQPQQSAPIEQPQQQQDPAEQTIPAEEAALPSHKPEVVQKNEAGQQQPPVIHKIEESMVKQILDNIMEHKVPMATAGAFGVVHYLYENEILANAMAAAVPVRSRKMCIFLHDYVLPTTREALAANLIQLLLPYLPYLRDKGVRSYSSGNYLASFVTTKLLGTTALYLAKLVTQTEQGKKLVTQYKRLPKKTKETIEKVVPWLNFARNVLVARSLAGYFE